jgi:hypothetical protein
MRAQGVVLIVAVGVALGAASASAEPKPTPVDIKAFRDKLSVFADANGGIYIVQHSFDSGDRRMFFGTAKSVYEQRIVGYSRNGDAWTINTWAPRLSDFHPAYFERKADGTFQKSCDGKDDAVLTQLTGDKAKAILDKTPIMTEQLVQRPHLLARDDAGIYYYVDRLAPAYGGKGYRVFVGKKGAMKQLDLTDIASDSAGEVFATKTGDLRLTRTLESGSTTSKAHWIKGEKKNELVVLDVEANSPVIFRDLGVYKFLGTLCDNI